MTLTDNSVMTMTDDSVMTMTDVSAMTLTDDLCHCSDRLGSIVTAQFVISYNVTEK